MVVQAVPVRDFMAAFAPRLGVKYKACGAALVTGRFYIEVAQDLDHAIREAGRSLSFAADGTWLVDCSAADQIGNDPLGTYVSKPLADAALGNGHPSYSRGLDPNSDAFKQAALNSYNGGQPLTAVPVHPVVTPDRYRHLETHYVSKSKFDFLEGLGLKVLGNPDVPGPLMLVGPAKIVDEAEKYIRAADICPRQLRVEATVITRANTRTRGRKFGLRIGNTKAGFGTAGNAASGLNLPLLTAFLEANRGVFEAGTNATFRGRVLEGEELKLSDGQDVPVRAATSVTDRETRQDVIYRTAGHQLGIKAVSLNDGEAVLVVDHSISALANASDLGPTFSTRSTASSFRITYGSPVILSLSGSDAANRQKSRGILSRNDAMEAVDTGSFLLLAVQKEGCGVAVGEDVQPKAAPQTSLRKAR
jgi:hypothetical protein